MACPAMKYGCSSNSTLDFMANKRSRPFNCIDIYHNQQETEVGQIDSGYEFLSVLANS